MSERDRLESIARWVRRHGVVARVDEGAGVVVIETPYVDTRCGVRGVEYAEARTMADARAELGY